MGACKRFYGDAGKAPASLRYVNAQGRDLAEIADPGFAPRPSKAEGWIEVGRNRYAPGIQVTEEVTCQTTESVAVSDATAPARSATDAARARPPVIATTPTNSPPECTSAKTAKGPGSPPPTATRPYRPSNGSEGHDFVSGVCGKCTRNRGGRCSIQNRMFLHEVDEPQYPTELVRAEAGPTCTAFQDKATTPVQPRRRIKPTEGQGSLFD